MIKNKNKLILGLGLTLAPIAFAVPLAITSCTSSNKNNNSDDLIDPYIQFEYQKNMDLYLNDNKNYVFENNGVIRQYASFQDDDTNSPTYNGWYLLLRDGNNNNKLIASFCGWNRNYLNKKEVYERINSQGYSIPSEISLPKNAFLTGWNKNTKIPVQAIGYDTNMMNYSEIALANSDSLDDFAENKLFFSENSSGLPILPYINNLNLLLNPIKYSFKYGLSTARWILPSSVNLVLPETLIFLDELYTSSLLEKNITFDFSKTKLTEIKYIRFNGGTDIKIILPNTCKRISYIDCDSSINNPNLNLEINLENVLYYGESAMRQCTFKNKKVVINKDAHYFSDPIYYSKLSFPDDVELVDQDGNVLRPVITNSPNDEQTL